MSDPFRTIAPPLQGDDLAEALKTAPVGRSLAFDAAADLNRFTGSIFSFLQADGRAAFQKQRERVFGQGFGDTLTAEEANRDYGIEGRLSFKGPISRNMAAWKQQEHQREAFNEEMVARGGLSLGDNLGAAVWGSLTDPVQIPFLFMGGEGALLKGLGVKAAGRAGAALRGAAVGSLDGVVPSIAIEAMDQGVKRAADRDAPLLESAGNVVLGGALGGIIGGVVGAVAGPAARGAARSRPAGRRVAVDARIEAEATRRGFDPATAVRIRQLENATGDAQARPVRNGRRLSSAHGVFQITDGTWRGLGGGDRNDVGRQVELGIENLIRERDGLRSALKREPADWEIYLAHQQGQGGARALLSNPGRNAIEVLTDVLERANPGRGAQLARKAVLDNGGNARMTAREFSSLWAAKFGVDDAAPRSPPVLNGLTENEKTAGALAAVDAMMRDAPVDLKALMARNGLDALDEASAVPSINGRWLEADAAVTRRGAEVPVRFAVVELRDLKTSHDDDLFPVPDYPSQLQPRDRTRAGSQAANFELERDLNPSLLMRDKAASGGAPIVSPDGVVESGNGRTIALRRSAQTGTEAWARYTAELERQGIDVSGFDRPVLVRMRSEPMTGADRAELARSLNEAPTEAFSPAEQARGDARRVDADLIGLIEGDDVFAAANRPFLRGFVQRVAPGDANALTDARGVISTSGRARVQAALVQAAYGDDALTAALFETTDAGMRGVGQALADAAPAWAKMRAEAPAEMDLTPALTSAVALMREARSARMSLGELLETRLGQMGLFGGEAITPETEALIRLMYRDEALTKPRGSERIADALRTYARGAAETPAGPDLFGATPDGKAFLDTLIQKYAGAEGEGRTGLAYAGGDEPLWSTRELSGAAAEPAGLDLRTAEPDGQRSGGTRQQPEGQRGAGDTGRKNEGQSAGVDRPPVQGFDVQYGQDGDGRATFFVVADDATSAAKGLSVSDGIFGWVEEGALKIEKSELRPEARGAGLGVAMYERAAQEAASSGKALASDFEVSVKAMRVWEALQKRGYAVERNPAATLKADPYTPYYRTADDSPVFFIPAPAKGSPESTATARLAALIDADPELKALMADTEALAAEAGVTVEPSTGAADPSTVAEAIRAAAVCLASEFVA